MIPFEVAKELAGEAVIRNGRLAYPWLDRPDTKFNADGEFRADIVLPKEEAKEFLEYAQSVAEEALAGSKALIKGGSKLKVRDLPYRENEDGTVTIKVKSKALFKRRDGTEVERRIPVVDAKKQPITGVRVGGGSLANVKVSLWPWHTESLGFGLKFNLQAVQILELVEGGRDATDSFEEVDDGYVVSEDGDF